MGKNVIILGAGFSKDAGIPLMSGFVDKMWHLAITKRCHETPLSEEDVSVFEAARSVLVEMESYHSRAKFDDRNIEDILSLLSFNILSGHKRAKDQLASMTKAITRTIELTCQVTHPGVLKPNTKEPYFNTGKPSYREFWKALFNWYTSGNELPTIITFNYDLVLERSLTQFFDGKDFVQDRVIRGVRDVRINYHYDNLPTEIWRIVNTGAGGNFIEKTGSTESDSHLDINILKLHGSVNFPKDKMKDGEEFRITKALDDPFILPPIFNKLSSSTPSRMWKFALERMKEANNVIILGYSLPQTDIYMQYFMKAAVGPNDKLNEVFVFNPDLAMPGAKADAMMERYNACFSDQLIRRVSYSGSHVVNDGAGTTTNFIHKLSHFPKSLLY